MDQRIPESIRPLLQDYLRLLSDQVPDLVAACYLYGSIALDAFNERLSDIDFLTVLHRRPTSQEVRHLQEIHKRLTTTYPDWPLDGSYLQWDDLGRLPDTVAPYPNVAQGVFHPHGERDLNLVTWWILKHHGVAILGPSPQTLAFTVDWDDLAVRMHDNLNSYWYSWTRSPTRLVQLFTDYGVQWSVLGVLRLWYSFREQDITSKTTAGRYALTHLPSRWHRLIQEAINLRNAPDQRLYACPIHRASQAMQFLHYMLQLCND
jgi:predicted nucleotidyltransferase